MADNKDDDKATDEPQTFRRAGVIREGDEIPEQIRELAKIGQAVVGFLEYEGDGSPKILKEGLGVVVVVYDKLNSAERIATLTADGNRKTVSVLRRAIASIEEMKGEGEGDGEWQRLTYVRERDDDTAAPVFFPRKGKPTIN